MSLPVFWTLVSASALAALVSGEARGAGWLRVASKPLASLAFVLVAITLGAPSGDSYARWILAGLVLAACGDVALMVPGSRAFLAGLVLFLLGHAAYVVACATRVAPTAWPSAWSLAPVFATAVALSWLWPHLGRMRLPVIAYVVTITLMVVAALATGLAAAPPLRWLLPAGATLFFASDLAVARNRFVAPGFVNRAWGLPTYYAGQLLLAWSVAP